MKSSLAAPAGAWRRYAAWSLDFALVGGTATALSWSRGAAAWEAARSAWGQLSTLLAGALADDLALPASPAALAGRLLSNPHVQLAAANVQHAIARLVLGWLLCYAVLAAAYHIGFERSRWRGSPGKRALRLSVVDAGGDTPVATGRLAWRHLAGALSWLTLNLGHALAVLPPHKRALHDWLSGTRVVSDVGDAPLPAWARAWLTLQVIATVALLAWGLRSYLEALQAAIAGGVSTG